MTIDQQVQSILFMTKDPTVELDGHTIPALTTLLHRVCGNDEGRFEEATRLCELFIRAALESKS